ncbi:MAG: tryptophan synthase subunit beta [Methylacidiphilales bacterium]|nr:tryptophan synthase subunit beta [Candidatus Methylacidiphilales bacterium]
MKFSVTNNELNQFDQHGYIGEFGGRYIPETLVQPCQELTNSFTKLVTDKKFIKEYNSLLKQYCGRPTPLTDCKRLPRKNPKTKIFLKREDLNHTGSHKINNALGQALLAKYMGKKFLLAETGAGQHGVATATIGALLDMPTRIYMGKKDMLRQSPNVARMKLLGATVIEVAQGSATLKDALNEALRDWVSSYRNSHYVIGSVNGPHPYPLMVRSFQRIIGRETKSQLKEFGILNPDVIVACVGGGSNAIGIFYDFIKQKQIALVGVEAGGSSLGHSASISKGVVGVLHGQKSYVLSDRSGLILPTHSISAGMDYPGVGPEHAYLHSIGRVTYCTISDQQALSAFHTLARCEGILAALESCHAISYALKLAMKPTKQIIVVNCSGRGDKDLDTIQQFAK